jgi:hypothetical protein
LYYLVGLIAPEALKTEGDVVPVATFKGCPIAAASIGGTLKNLTISGDEITLGSDWTGSGSYSIIFLVADEEIVNTEQDFQAMLIYPPVNFNGNTSVYFGDFASAEDANSFTISDIPVTYQSDDWNAHVLFFEDIPTGGLYTGTIIRGDTEHEGSDLKVRPNTQLQDQSYFAVVVFSNYDIHNETQTATFTSGNGKISI